MCKQNKFSFFAFRPTENGKLKKKIMHPRTSKRDTFQTIPLDSPSAEKESARRIRETKFAKPHPEIMALILVLEIGLAGAVILDWFWASQMVFSTLLFIYMVVFVLGFTASTVLFVYSILVPRTSSS